MEKITFEFSWETIFRVGFLFVTLYALYRVREVLLLVVFAVVISLLFNPLVDFLTRRKVPRQLSVIFIYLSVFGLFALLIYLFAPLLILEVHYFSQGFSQYFEKIAPPFRTLGLESFDSFENFMDLIQRLLSKASQNVFTALFSIFGGIFTTVFVIFLSFFLSLEEKAVERSLFLFFPAESEQMALDLWRRCEKRVSGWFLSRVLSSLFIAALTYLALLILGSDYPFSLSLLAGVSNLIPFAGAFLSSFLIFLVLYAASPARAVLGLIIYLLIQQVENHVLLPILSKKFVDLSPVLVMIALAVGASLGGFWGAFLGIPLAGILLEFGHDFLKKRREAEMETEAS